MAIWANGESPDLNFFNSVDAPGIISMFAGSSAPTGWLMCNGAAVSRATYADLFSIIGTTYGVGDGSTTFNVPDFQGNVAVGYKSGDADFGSLNDSGGEKTHVLLEAELATHTHVQNAHDHVYEIRGGTGGALQGNASATLGAATSVLAYNGDIVNDATATNQNTGSNTAHNNLQPFLVVNFIIKT